MESGVTCKSFLTNLVVRICCIPESTAEGRQAKAVDAGSSVTSPFNDPKSGSPNGSAAAENTLEIWEHVRDSVRLWGDCNGVCHPQPLFDVISVLITLDDVAQRACGIHQASVHMGSNEKTDFAHVPLVEGESQPQLGLPGTLSLTARTPLDEKALRSRLDDFLNGDMRITDPEILGAIHAQDIDFSGVDNTAAVLCLARCLKQSGAKHDLHTFVSTRRFTSEFAESVVHADSQFRVTTTKDLSKYEVVPSILPYAKEMAFEQRVHSESDMSELSHYECAVLSTQLRRAGLGETVVRRSGVFEKAGVSGNIHKLTWHLYNNDGSCRTPEAYSKDAYEHFECGVGDSSQRRKRFLEQTSPLRETPAPARMEEFFEYCRKHPQDKIVVHCGGPLCVLRALMKQEDLRKRVILIGAMFLCYDGQANLLGKNFNEAVAPRLTKEVFSEDGMQPHRSFPNARFLCTTTETCKSPALMFVPFKDTFGSSHQRQPPRVAAPIKRNGSFCMDARHIPAKQKYPQPLLIISDDGKDPDDELAKVLVSSLTRSGLAMSCGYISNLHPAKDRARLARGTLDKLGMSNVPVAIGEAMNSSTVGSYELDAPYMADLKDCEENGVELFVRILNDLEEGVLVTLICLSGLTDAWLLLKNHRELFIAKIGRVVIMGGIEVDGDSVKLDKNGYMMPDKASNNMFDVESAQHLYREIQKECIPLTIVTRWAAYAAKLPFEVYDAMAATGHPVGMRLQKNQRRSLEHLWLRACMPPNDPRREGLRDSCDKAWFCKVFLGGKGQGRRGEDSIWDLASTFQAYDPVAVLAAVHSVRARFVRPLLIDVQGARGRATHEILGMNELNNGISEGKALADWLHTAMVNGLSSSDGAEHRRHT